MEAAMMQRISLQPLSLVAGHFGLHRMDLEIEL